MRIFSAAKRLKPCLSVSESWHHLAAFRASKPERMITENARETRLAPKPTPNDAGATGMLRDFFVGEIRDIYWAETKLLEAIPEMREAATSESLKTLLGKHLEETRQHVARLEQAFQLLGVPAEAVTCEAMAGIVREGQEIVAETQAGTATRDVGIILAAQKVEHYEIGTYGALVQLALLLGLREVSGLLNATLDEEKGADKLLSLAASGGINQDAAAE
jgi:ferritin-like metal-binding protein YciE